MNVQIVCNADLLIMDCVARNPGSFKRVQFFGAMERRLPMVNRLVLGDSDYPIRDWLMTLFPQQDWDQQEAYNMAHRRTRVTVESENTTSCGAIEKPRDEAQKLTRKRKRDVSQWKKN